MTNLIYPIGYNRYGARERIEELMQQPKMLMIDTRLKAYSWKGVWCEEHLRELWGKRYRVAGNFLGNLNYKSKGGPIRIVNPATGIGGLVGYLNGGWDLLLLCQCTSYEECHMKVIVELLVGVRPEVEVIKFVQPVIQGSA